MKVQYYIVTAKCGHVGKNNYILIDFPIKASSKKKAASIARNRPRVKHHDKHAIVQVREVSPDEFMMYEEKLNLSGYYKATCIQEQRINFPEYYEQRIQEDKHRVKRKKNQVPVRLLKQLLAVSEYGEKEYKEMKRSSIWQNRLTIQN